MRTRRVGGFTCGVVLVVFGVMMLLHSFIPTLTYELILSFWPVILIVLGVELLIANTVSCFKDNKNCQGDNQQSSFVEFKYDLAAIVLMFVIVLFSVGMGFAEFCLKYYS